jgi:hypothetical protein
MGILPPQSQRRVAWNAASAVEASRLIELTLPVISSLQARMKSAGNRGKNPVSVKPLKLTLLTPLWARARVSGRAPAEEGIPKHGPSESGPRSIQ